MNYLNGIFIYRLKVIKILLRICIWSNMLLHWTGAVWRCSATVTYWTSQLELIFILSYHRTKQRST